MFDKHFLRSRRATLHPIDNNDIGTGFDCQLHIIVSTSCTDLDVDRHLPVSNFTQFQNFDRQIIRASPVWMTAGTALIDAHWQGTHFGNAFGNLLPQ